MDVGCFIDEVPDEIGGGKKVRLVE